ncbi:uncharacterized protein LOC135716050 [Ochlerotatus camptorhynchus]|uniref:uncharacterized protein LOC135716050 n=1 Tax=Ochlerotatus camptorhynchus TaxID=644619 RepID=UPI0031DDDD4C
MPDLIPATSRLISLYRSLNDEDLMMEPDEHSGDSATQATVRRSTAVSALHLPYNQHIYITATRRDENEQLTDEEKAAATSQGFYPSFMRSSRQYFQPSESDRFRQSTAGRAKFAEQVLLGSGDFGVLKGGTFYQDTDPPLRAFHNDFYGLNLKSHNGHQRPFAAPLVQKFRYPSESSDPFSNFRDFADINVSNDAGQYSEFYVVYANKNSSQTKPDVTKKKIDASKKPIRNIKDQLDLIDKEKSSEHKLAKLSKSKIKLVKIRKQADKKSKIKIPVDVTSTTLSPDSESDFMLALS